MSLLIVAALLLGAPVKLGVINSMTGPEAPIGENLTNGIKLAQEDLAKKGVQVELVWEDDTGKPQDSLSAMEKLATRDNVAGVVGPYTSAAANAVAIVPQLCGTYMAVVYSPRIMPLWEQGRLFAVFKTFQRNLVLACVGIYIIAAAGLSQFGTWLLPQNFARSSSVILVLLPAALCGLVNFPWTVSLLLFMRPQFLLVFEAASFVLLVPLYGYVVPAWGAIGGAAVSTGFALLKTFVYQSVAWRVLRSQPGTVPEQSTFLVPKELRT